MNRFMVWAAYYEDDIYNETSTMKVFALNARQAFMLGIDYVCIMIPESVDISDIELFVTCDDDDVDDE